MITPALLPSQPITVTPRDSQAAADSLVDAILDARDPSLLTTTAGIDPRGPEPNPFITATLGGVEWRLGSYGYYRALGELTHRSIGRPPALPNLQPAMDALSDAIMLACRLRAAFVVRSV